MVDDADRAAGLVAQHQIGNADKAIAADIQLEFILHGKNLAVAKTVEGGEILKPFLVILTRQSAREWWEIFLDCFIVFSGVSICEFKGHQLALCPAFEEAVAMGAVGSIGVLKLRQLVNILLFERQWALIIELQLTERPFHIVGDQTHGLLLS